MSKDGEVLTLDFARNRAALVIALIAFPKLHPLPQTRTVRDVNSLMVIALYKYQGSWVFDDPATGLLREPFIAGIDTMIDEAVAKIPNAEKDFEPFSAPPSFRVRTSNWTGDGQNRAGIGITATNSRWRAGSVPRC